VLDLEDQNVCEAALEENLKRRDLNPLEKAQAFQDYVNRFGTSLEVAATRFSMQRSTLSNYLRLLELPEPVKQSLIAEKITNGHARAILSLESEEARIALCRRIESEALSVRATEQAVRDLQRETDETTIPFPSGGGEQSPAATPSNHVRSLEQQLRDQLGAPVEIKLSGKDKGRIIIRFNSNDEFEHIVQRLRDAA
jgi:ParB family chromosome partitioning protein